jgi:hypothetical protein
VLTSKICYQADSLSTREEICCIWMTSQARTCTFQHSLAMNPVLQ